MPLVDHEAEVLQVTLLVEGQGAGRGLEAVGAQRGSDFVGVGAAGLLHAFGHDLYGGVGREHERAARVLVLGLEGLDQRLVLRILVEGLRQGDQQAFGGRAGDGGDFLVTHAFRAHELGLQAFLGGLTQQQAQLRVVAAVVDEVDVGLLELGDQRGEVLVAGVDAFEHGNLGAFAFQGLLDRGGDAFAVLLLVVNDGNGLRLDVVGDEVTGGRALQAVQADGTEYQLVATSGDVRAGGSRGNHHDAFVFVNVGRRLSGAGAEVANNIFHFVVDDLVGYGHGLFRITGVVVLDAFEHCTVHPAGLVDLLDGHFGTDELHFAVLGNGTGHRTGQSDLDGVSSHRIAGGAGQGHSGKQLGHLLGSLFHSAPLL